MAYNHVCSVVGLSWSCNSIRMILCHANLPILFYMRRAWMTAVVMQRAKWRFCVREKRRWVSYSKYLHSFPFAIALFPNKEKLRSGHWHSHIYDIFMESLKCKAMYYIRKPSGATLYKTQKCTAAQRTIQVEITWCVHVHIFLALFVLGARRIRKRQINGDRLMATNS